MLPGSVRNIIYFLFSSNLHICMGNERRITLVFWWNDATRNYWSADSRFAEDCRALFKLTGHTVCNCIIIFCWYKCVIIKSQLCQALCPFRKLSKRYVQIIHNPFNQHITCAKAYERSHLSLVVFTLFTFKQSQDSLKLQIFMVYQVHTNDQPKI